MTQPKRVSMIGILLLALFASLIVWDFAHANGGDHDEGNSVVNTDSAIANRTLALNMSGSDMDINDCLATHSVLFGIWQGTHVNPMCEAARLNAQGNYDAAAKLKCSTKKYRKVFGKGQVCIDAVIFIPPPEPVQVVEDDARYEALIEELAQIRVQQQEQQQQIEERPAVSTARVETKIQKQQDDLALRRARAKEAYQKALEGGE